MSKPTLFFVGSLSEEQLQRALKRLDPQARENDARAVLCAAALSQPARLMGVQIAKCCVIPIGSFN